MSDDVQWLLGLTLHPHDAQIMPAAMSHQRVTLELALQLQRALADAEKERDALVAAIDNEMVTAHIGVFNRGDNPAAALHQLGVWHQSVGEHFAKQRLADAEARAERAERWSKARAMFMHIERDSYNAARIEREDWKDRAVKERIRRVDAEAQLQRVREVCERDKVLAAGGDDA